MGKLGQEETSVMIYFAPDRGVNFIDTANVCSNLDREDVWPDLRFREQLWK